MKSVQAIFFGLICGVMILATRVHAQQQEPKPIIVINPKATDPQDFPWIGDAGVKALTGEIAKHKSGSVYAFVFAGAPSKAWDYFDVGKSDFVSLEELARRAVENCEYSNHGAPCFILSVNGNDAHDTAGNLPAQPLFLDDLPTTFDAARVPFLTNKDRSALAAYAQAARPRVLVVTSDGWWTWNTGKNVLDAISKDEAACQKHSTTDTCLLYAVDDKVVFASPGVAAAPVHAEEQQPRPIIVSNQNPVDPKAFPWLDAGGVKALTDYIAQQKSGSISAFVFAVGSKTAWVGQPAKKTDIISVGDLARVTLQRCEYNNNGAPCFILSINGKDGRDASGTLPMQPALLDSWPTTFNLARVPFIWNEDRGSLSAYMKIAGPRALVLTLYGWWHWESGKTLLDAIARDQAACKKAKNICLLYAVNDQVVFSPFDY